jgi:hypothetical protein
VGRKLAYHGPCLAVRVPFPDLDPYPSLSRRLGDAVTAVRVRARARAPIAEAGAVCQDPK